LTQRRHYFHHPFLSEIAYLQRQSRFHRQFWFERGSCC
jgi:hypothetical protein